MSQRNIKLTIAYDGSNYHGWQCQRDGLITVQQTLQDALVRVLKHPVTSRGSGRTDAAVHAAAQVATFRTDTPIPTANLHHAINTRLPRDIRVLKAEVVPDDFDAITSAHSKLYRYTVYSHSPLPACADKYCYHFYRPCQVPPMQTAAELLVGEHDFASFVAAGSKRQSTVRTIFRCQVWQKFHWLYFDIEADGFLYHMVRNIVGTLLEIGRGHWQPQRLGEILAARDRSLAGPMVPAKGLSLQWVKY